MKLFVYNDDWKRAKILSKVLTSHHIHHYIFNKWKRCDFCILDSGRLTPEKLKEILTEKGFAYNQISLPPGELLFGAVNG